MYLKSLTSHIAHSRLSEQVAVQAAQVQGAQVSPGARVQPRESPGEGPARADGQWGAWVWGTGARGRFLRAPGMRQSSKELRPGCCTLPGGP